METPLSSQDEASDVTNDVASTWGPWLLKLSAAVVLCAASSPSPIGLPLALIFAFQPEFLQKGWALLADTVSVPQLLIVGMPLVGGLTYFLHGFICLAFDTVWRPEVLKQFKIQKGKYEEVRLTKASQVLMHPNVEWASTLLHVKCTSCHSHTCLSLEIPWGHHYGAHVVREDFWSSYALRLLFVPRIALCSAGEPLPRCPLLQIVTNLLINLGPVTMGYAAIFAIWHQNGESSLCIGWVSVDA